MYSSLVIDDILQLNDHTIFISLCTKIMVFMGNISTLFTTEDFIITVSVK